MITLDRAIEVLTDNCPLPSDPTLREFGDAIQLGIEGLREIKDLRMGHYESVCPSLPGETKEGD